MHKGEFILHPHCTSASGDCFYQGRCLGACSAQQKQTHEQRIKSLENRVVQLERALSHVTHWMPLPAAPTQQQEDGK